MRAEGESLVDRPVIKRLVLEGFQFQPLGANFVHFIGIDIRRFAEANDA